MSRILYSVIILLLAVTFLTSCSGKNNVNKDMTEVAGQVKPPVEISIGKETELLLKDLEENGDYVNSREYPSLIRASIVHDELNGNNLVIDLRSPQKYTAGHIRGAVSKRIEDLPGYFESGIKPFEYDKIILVCDDGQLSGYATSLLRLKGYGNVFAMRWGMSSWNKMYADEGWLAGLSGRYESMLDTTTASKPMAKGMPDLNTGLTTGSEVADARFEKVFDNGSENIFVTADEVFKNPSGYFIINLDRKDKYEDGHIPGAVRYKPDATLSFTDEMATIPSDRTVVVYCGTGHNSAFATAFLRLMGYDARTLKYGNNSFMYNRMEEKRNTLSWLPFDMSDINNFETVK